MKNETQEELAKTGLYGLTVKPYEHYDYEEEMEEPAFTSTWTIGNLARSEYGKKIKEWESLYGGEIATVFVNSDFIMNFIEKFPNIEDQMKYVTNTTNAAYNRDFDPEYAIVTRRSVPSETAKPESFWCNPEEARRPITGIKTEINGPQRLHTVVLVSTLKRLQEHGLSGTIGAGSTDGEIVIDPNKPFNNFLFQFKPISEFYKLADYLSKGGKTREEVLEDLKRSAYDRAVAQGLQDLNTELYKRENILNKFKDVESKNVEMLQGNQEDYVVDLEEDDEKWL